MLSLCRISSLSHFKALVVRDLHWYFSGNANTAAASSKSLSGHSLHLGTCS